MKKKKTIYLPSSPVANHCPLGEKRTAFTAF